MSTAILSPTRDRFELDRLAEELAKREGANATADASAAALPIFIPLARDNLYLSAEEFDVEEFLLSRIAHSDLPDLRAELREYLGTLKEELVQLINDDYEAFISLSTDLRGEGETLVRLQQPLGELKNAILVSNASSTLMRQRSVAHNLHAL
jgi:conserved oligomeric Golgi complex subunit 2